MTRFIREAIGAAVVAACIFSAASARADVPVPPPHPLRVQDMPPPPPPSRGATPRVLCRDRAEIIGVLRQRFDETQRSFGLQSDGLVLEMYAAPSGSWTALITRPDGTSCIVASGEAWTELPPPPVGDPA